MRLLRWNNRCLTFYENKMLQAEIENNKQNFNKPNMKKIELYAGTSRRNVVVNYFSDRIII